MRVTSQQFRVLVSIESIKSTSFCQHASPSNQLLYIDYPLAGKYFLSAIHKNSIINLGVGTFSFTTWRLETVGGSFPSCNFGM